MAPPAFGFDPPPVTYQPELRWVLWRGLGPREGSPGMSAGSGDDAVTLAEGLDLAARIGARTAVETLVAEVGPSAAERCRDATRRAAARALHVQETIDRVATVAKAAGLRLGLLKGAALLLGGHVELGSRRIADVDVLAAGGGAERLQAALIAAGFTPCGSAAYEHHLPPLADPLGAVVEVHHVLWGVFLAGNRRSARFEDLEVARLLRPAPCPGGGAPGTAERSGLSLPAPAALAAHAVLHGLVQHGLSPAAYPSLRVLADLLDLGLGEALEIDEVAPLVAGHVTLAELEAVGSLCRAVAAGELDALIMGPRPVPARRLLDHLVAGQLDIEYAASLKRRLLDRPFSDRPRPAARRAALLHALWPPLPTEADGSAQRRRHPVARLLRRLGRPADLALRLLRSQLSELRLRWRSPER